MPLVMLVDGACFEDWEDWEEKEKELKYSPVPLSWIGSLSLCLVVVDVDVDFWFFVLSFLTPLPAVVLVLGLEFVCFGLVFVRAFLITSASLFRSSSDGWK